MRIRVLGTMVLGVLLAACSTGQRAEIGVPGASGAPAADSAETPTSGPSRPSEQLVRQAQSELKREGLYLGKIDGIAGPETNHAIATFRQREKLQQTAYLDRATVERMRLRALRMEDVSDSTEASNAATEGR